VFPEPIVTDAQASATMKPSGRARALFVIAGLAVLMGIAVFAYVRVQQFRKKTAVLTAASALEKDTLLDFDMLSARPVAERTLDDSVVRTSCASFIMHKRVKVPIAAGAQLHWSDVDTDAPVNDPNCEKITQQIQEMIQQQIQHSKHAP